MPEPCPYSCVGGIVYQAAGNYGTARPCPACWRAIAEREAARGAYRSPAKAPDAVAGLCEAPGFRMATLAFAFLFVGLMMACAGALEWLRE